MAEEKSTKRAHNFKDITGHRFGRLTVLRLAERNGKDTCWLCACDCGGEVITRKGRLLRGYTSSCGCKRREQLRTHGLSRTSEYMTWASAKQRCVNPSSREYAYYGGRGITMSKEWAEDFTAFYRDMGPRPDGTELDRVDNDGPYTGPCAEYPRGNCRWVTRSEQMKNRRHWKVNRKHSSNH